MAKKSWKSFKTKPRKGLEIVIFADRGAINDDDVQWLADHDVKVIFHQAGRKVEVQYLYRE